jgi:peroxiredoxin
VFWAGAILAVAMMPIFFAQVFWAETLITPWYLPIGGTLAALAVLYAAAARWRRWWTVCVALVCVALAGFEWFFLLVATVLPAYEGPLAAGGTMPSFRATLADGAPIDESYFRQNHDTAVIFFQGRWCPFCMTQLAELERHHDELDRVGAKAVVVSIEDQDTAAQTQRDFPHLVVVSDHERELSNAAEVINKGFSPDGGDSAATTILLVDGQGTIRWLHRPTRFIAVPSAAQLATRIEGR